MLLELWTTWLRQQVGGRLDITSKYFANPVGKGRPAR